MKKTFSFLLSCGLFLTVAPFAALAEDSANTVSDASSTSIQTTLASPSTILCPNPEAEVTFEGRRAVFMAALKVRAPELYHIILARMQERNKRLANLCAKHPRLYQRLIELQARIHARLEGRAEDRDGRTQGNAATALNKVNELQTKLEERQKKLCEKYPNASSCADSPTSNSGDDDRGSSPDDDDQDMGEVDDSGQDDGGDTDASDEDSDHDSNDDDIVSIQQKKFEATYHAGDQNVLLGEFTVNSKADLDFKALDFVCAAANGIDEMVLLKGITTIDEDAPSVDTETQFSGLRTKFAGFTTKIAANEPTKFRIYGSISSGVDPVVIGCGIPTAKDIGLETSAGDAISQDEISGNFGALQGGHPIYLKE